MSPPSDASSGSVGSLSFSSIGYVLNRASVTTSALASRHCMEELGITATQAAVVRLLATSPAVTAADLARAYGIDASAATRLISRMEKRGLLSRQRDGQDRRVVRIALTAQGHALADGIPDCFMHVRNKLVAGFAPDELASLKEMLRRILTNAEEAAARPMPAVPPKGP